MLGVTLLRYFVNILLVHIIIRQKITIFNLKIILLFNLDVCMFNFFFLRINILKYKPPFLAGFSYYYKLALGNSNLANLVIKSFKLK